MNAFGPPLTHAPPHFPPATFPFPIQVDLAVDKSAKAQKHFAATSTLDDRIALCNRFLDEIVAHKDQIAADITAQMGKPLAGVLLPCCPFVP